MQMVIKSRMISNTIKKCIGKLRKESSSSSSSNTVQGSVLLPHYRTLEVRPGRIS